MTRVAHIVPEIDEANGVWRVASLLAREKGGAVVPAAAPALAAAIADAEEVWVHGAWLPRLWRASLQALRAGKCLVRMTHGSLSPVYLKHQSPLKKRLVGPIERFFLRRADVVVATCQAEAEWIRKYEPRVKKIEVTDIKRFFDLNHEIHETHEKGQPLHLLYLGRRHPLKGVEYLEAALGKCENVEVWKYGSVENANEKTHGIIFRSEDSVFGEEKEKAWDWCDVLILPTLSENFGLVVAEALERGKRVITTDGAPAWGDGNDYGGRLVYIKGYREGTREERIALIQSAIEKFKI